MGVTWIADNKIKKWSKVSTNILKNYAGFTCIMSVRRKQQQRRAKLRKCMLPSSNLKVYLFKARPRVARVLGITKENLGPRIIFML